METRFQLSQSAARRGNLLLLVLLAVSWSACAAGYATDARQFFASYLVAFTFFLTIGLGAAFFLMAWNLSGAVWNLTVRRLMENMMVTLPLAPLLFLPVVAGIPVLYEWAQPEFLSADPVLQVKMVFFNRAFFLSRAAVYFLIWSIVAIGLYRKSIRQDGGASPDAVKSSVAWSAPGLALLMITVTMAAVDWLMSLEPHWYSTIFGVYVFAGGGLAFLAALILLSLALRRGGHLEKEITVEHYHDLGRWMFALVIFWTYIGFSQYLLIWYANLPEETVWYRHRLEGNWSWVSAALLVGGFIVPFLLLVSRGAKRNLPLLGSVAVLLLGIHYVDLHWIVMPTVHHHGFHLHWMDLAALAAAGSAFGLVFWRLLSGNPLIPIGDLRLSRALHHHTD